MYEFAVRKNDSPLGFMLYPHELEYMSNEAKLAWSFADKILLSDGMKEVLASVSETEHSQTVQQIAVRACELAEYMMTEMRQRDWIQKAPNLKECLDKVK